MSLNRKSITGLSMIEILITVLLVNFSILALTKMQLTNMNRTTNSLLELKAAFFAESLTEKLRINSTLAKASNSPYLLNDWTDTPASVPTTNVCVTTVCEATELAQYDMNTWLFKLKNNFPTGKAKITKVDAAGYSMYTISIQWKIKQDAANQYDVVVPI